jgi:DNA-binding beta-propeller fold protein YncE
MPWHLAKFRLHSAFWPSLALLSTILLSACGRIQATDDPNSGTTGSGTAPVISVQPQSTSVPAGQRASFFVTAIGTAPLSYQWRLDGAAITGATAARYTSDVLQLADDGEKFSVVVSNAAGATVSSAATLTVTAGSPPVTVPPTITIQPQPQTVSDGSTATFTVSATGSAPLHYQWLKNGAPVGADSASYTTPIVTLTDSGEIYSVVITNPSTTTATSAPALLTVRPIAASISTQPMSQAVTLGGTATFTVVAGGSAPLTYQWYKYGVAISGATAASYTTPATVASDSGSEFTVTVSNPANMPVTSVPAALLVKHTLALIAGELGGVGHTDATGPNASFYTPEAVATDPAGNIYVVDEVNEIIRKITPAGVVTTLAGTPGVIGSADGTGPTASFNFNTTFFPGGAVVCPDGNLYVSDTDNSTIRRISLPGGVVVTPAGTALVSGSVDGVGVAAQFRQPSGLACDSNGNLYIADTDNDTIRVMVTATRSVTTLAGNPTVVGSTDGTGGAALFNRPTGVAVDAAGANVYVADYLNSTIRQVTSAGVVTTLAGNPGVFAAADGTGGAARFSGPEGVAIDSTGANLYVADTGNLTIRQVTLPGAVVTTVAGTAGSYGSADGTGAAASFANPTSVATDANNDVYVGDADNNSVRKLTTPAAAVTTLAGNIGGRGYADGSSGPNSTARFNQPHFVVSDAAGDIYVSDEYNNVIRKIAAGGTVTTLAGTAGIKGSIDGTGAAAAFNAPYGMVVDSHGNLYVADSGNNTIRMVTPGGAVTTLAGTAGVTGSADGTGAAASFNTPLGLAIDATDTLYVADYGNNTVRKVTTPGGAVSTFVGTAGVTGSADGTGAGAQFSGPLGLSVNLTSGNAYLADRFNDTIRMITPAGVVSTIAGSPGQADFVDGTGAAAHFSWPATTVVDPATGNVYVADYLHNAIRMIAAGNVVTTVVGQSPPGVPDSVVVLGSLSGSLSGPSSMAIVDGPALELIICDAVENAVLLATLP